MSGFYLNHSVLAYQKEEKEIKIKLKEIVEVISYLKTEKFQVFVFSNLWDVAVLGGTLRSFLHSMPNQEEAKLIMLGLVNTGPFYYEDVASRSLITTPIVTSNSFVYKLLNVCFNEKHSLIVSLKEEKDLIARKYHISEDYHSHEVDNYIGKDELPAYFESIDRPNNIEDVFRKVSEKRSNIVILDKAKKSARQHNFQGRFSDVMNGLLALVDIELKLLLEDVSDEERKKIFLDETRLKISGESDETLKVRKYKTERECVIPGLGKEVFEWHVKIGNKTRIHYYIDKDTHRIYIGHCGKHLGTVSHNS